MNNDLISRSEAKKLGATCLARRNENGQLEAIISLDEVPTVETDIEVVAKDAYKQGYTDGWKERFGEPNEKPQGEWILLETDCDDGGNNRYECSECHYSDVHASSAEVPFCWHCGAGMKGGAE